MARDFKISESALSVLRESSITETTVALPPRQLPRDLYLEVDKALKAAGGKWSRSARVHVFTRDPRQALGLTIESGKAVNHKQVKQAFYTPAPLARRIAALADLRPGHRVLEPSCGEGSLVKAALEAEPSLAVMAYDIDPDALEKIRDPRVSLHCCDFLKVPPVAEFDRVIMNPPFTKLQDVTHVTHALKFLRPGGRLVAVTYPTWRTRETRRANVFREMLEEIDHDVELLEAGTFAESGTETETLLLTVTT